jgi:hypothetical protein
MKTLGMIFLTLATFFALVAPASAGPAIPPAVPENGSTFLFLGIALIILVAVRRRFTRQTISIETKK